MRKSRLRSNVTGEAGGNQSCRKLSCLRRQPPGPFCGAGGRVGPTSRLVCRPGAPPLRLCLTQKLRRDRRLPGRADNREAKSLATAASQRLGLALALPAADLLANIQKLRRRGAPEDCGYGINPANDGIRRAKGGMKGICRRVEEAVRALRAAEGIGHAGEVIEVGQHHVVAGGANANGSQSPNAALPIPEPPPCPTC
jgi:hypothetical protein